MEKRLRISLVTETFPPEINGVAMTISRLMKELGKAGHELQLVRPTQSNDTAIPRLSAETIRVAGISIPGYRQLRFGLPATATLIRSWRRRRPDIIYVATEGPLGWSAVRAANRLGIPAVSGFHTQFHQYSTYYRIGWLKPLVFRYLRSLHNRTACTLVPTEAMRDDLLNTIPAIEVLGRGIDTGLFNPTQRSTLLRESWGAAPSDKVFLYVGRLAKEKNIDLAIETFRHIQHNNPSARLVVVGDGPEYQQLQGKHHGVIFAGSQVGHSLASHYASADIFLFPSLSETFGNVVLEAMASGLAVVAFDQAAAAIHIHHEQNGILVPPSNDRLFITYTEQLVSDPIALDAIRQAARRSVMDMGWRVIGRQFEQILRTHANKGTSNESRKRMAADFSS